MTGYTVREAMHMVDYPVQIIHPDDRERITEVLRGALGGSSGSDIQFQILHKNGSAIWGAISWQPIHNETGACIGYRSSVRNITQRKQAELALDSLRKSLRNDDVAFAGIVGRHPRMKSLFETIREVVDNDVPVAIAGESGTGKELVAQAIHNQGPRANKPFIAVNCSALPDNLLESELFGHVKGAFTGAIKSKRGRFELADGGTIFLDEVGDLTPAVQVSLLRVIQEGTIDRVGDEHSTRVDVRVISATHKDLREEVIAGRFREDLYYRLCVIPIVVPPLRQRIEDVPLLAMHIIASISKNSQRKEITMTDEALDMLMSHHWPGNVRELQNAIHFAAVKCKGDEILPHHLPPTIGALALNTPRPVYTGAAPVSPVHNDVKRGRKPVLATGAVQEALRRTNNNRVEAARLLGVSRATLYRYLEQGG
ncbi:MAG: sigma 54-interacting transcriptional regulator [Candidatus Sumerlaeota bacterium]